MDTSKNYESLTRSTRRVGETYLWDSSLVPERAPRFENLVALHLLKLCHVLQDTQGFDVELFYLRDRDGRELDFLVTAGRKPRFAVETKLAETRLDPSLAYFRSRLDIPFVYQVTLDGTRDFVEDRVRVLPARFRPRSPRTPPSLRTAAFLHDGAALVPRGLYRFSSFEEADTWMTRMMIATRAPEPDDVLRICRALNEAGARYLLIGGFAVVVPGAARFTKDIALLVDGAVERGAPQARSRSAQRQRRGATAGGGSLGRRPSRASVPARRGSLVCDQIMISREA